MVSKSIYSVSLYLDTMHSCVTPGIRGLLVVVCIGIVLYSVGIHPRVCLTSALLSVMKMLVARPVVLFVTHASRLLTILQTGTPPGATAYAYLCLPCIDTWWVVYLPHSSILLLLYVRIPIEDG